MSTPGAGRVRLDERRCTGLGLCESVAPDVFEVGDDGTLTVLLPEVDGDRLDAVRTAVATCPTAALRLDG